LLPAIPNAAARAATHEQLQRSDRLRRPGLSPDNFRVTVVVRDYPRQVGGVVNGKKRHIVRENKPQKTFS
jgi:hypothetical protein